MEHNLPEERTMLLKHWMDTDYKEAEEKLAEIIENCIPSVLK